jgi:hypothetical protein
MKGRPDPSAQFLGHPVRSVLSEEEKAPGQTWSKRWPTCRPGAQLNRVDYVAAASNKQLPGNYLVKELWQRQP